MADFNKELLLKVKVLILQHPENFHMANWVGLRDEFEIFPVPTDRPFFADVPDCGTTACLAGWALSISEEGYAVKGCRSLDRHRTTLQDATELLGLLPWQADKLFSSGQWQSEYSSAYNRHILYKDWKSASIVAANFIDYFIECMEGKKPWW